MSSSLPGRVALGGTFDIIHKGHVSLLSKALEYTEVYIGLTSDEYVLREKGRLLRSYDERRDALERHLSANKHKIKIFKIEDRYGFTITEPSLDAIVVSTETLPTAQKINAIRQAAGMKPLKIIKVPILYSQDLKKLSASDVISGKVDSEGNRLIPLYIAVGSENPTKIQAVSQAFKGFLSLDSHIYPVKTSTFTKQPLNAETISCAIDRAKQAWDSRENLDYSVGIESGIFSFDEYSLDIAIAAVYDGNSVSLGNSMGFQLPSHVIQNLAPGRELGEIVEKLSGIKDIGKKEGIISYLSGGRLKRLEMNVQAVKCALVHRFSQCFFDALEIL